MKILLTGAFNYSKQQIDQIKEIGLEIIFECDEKNIKSDLSDIDIVVGNAIFLYNDIKKFKNLKYIQLTSAGLDRVPIEYINENNIELKNARGVYSIPMAEWTVAKILEICKNTKFFINNQKYKKWEKYRNIIELSEKNVCIVGYGSVGEEIAKRLKSFNTHIFAIDKNMVNSKYIDKSLLISDIDKVLKISDIIILTLPLTKETEYLFDENMFKKMKDKSIFINIARGKIVREKDLIKMLKQDKFLGVILDVFENEPLSEDSELWNFENVILTPHNSFVSENNNDRMFEVILKNLKEYKKGRN